MTLTTDDEALISLIDERVAASTVPDGESDCFVAALLQILVDARKREQARMGAENEALACKIEERARKAHLRDFDQLVPGTVLQ